MRCWNCGKKIPDDAKACKFCEASAETELTEEEIEAVEGILDEMPPETLEEFHRLVHESKDAEDFVNRIMVGECPQCGSDQTGDCEADPEIEDLLVGRCYACGQLFCTECRRLLEPSSPHCECPDDEDDEADEP